MTLTMPNQGMLLFLVCMVESLGSDGSPEKDCFPSPEKSCFFAEDKIKEDSIFLGHVQERREDAGTIWIVET